MSTDRKRLTSAIQRIAREDPEIRALLDDFRNSGGKPSEAATSGSGAEDRQICCDGSSSSSGNPGSDTRDPADNPQDGIDPDDPAKISDNLTGVTDCATGQPICFSGNDWIPPEGWDGPTDPPFAEGYEEGAYWISNSATGSIKFASPEGVCTSIYANYDTENTIYGGIRKVGDDEYYCQAKIESGPSAGRTISIGVIYKSDCGESSESYCTDVPYEDTWPEDGCVNLATKGGKLVGSKFDPENDGSYSKPMDSIELCDEFGNSFELSPSASGGWKSISSQNPDDGYLYNAQGQQIARISESEYSDPSV